jgi:TatD DNase family protein
MPNDKLVDTHTHICDPIFDPDRETVLDRAAAAGVAAVIALGEDMADAERNIQLAENHPILRPAAGLYPTILDSAKAGEMRNFIRQKRPKLVAIGEVGLDFWVVTEAAAKEIQQEIFRSFIELSKELGLPLNVHSRSAGRQAIGMLLEHGATRVQLHAFDGKSSTAAPAVEAGYFFSVPPSVVRSRQKQKLVKSIPLSCLLVETDSPVLGPDPQQRNEPANVLLSIKAIAELKNVGEDEVRASVSENTKRLYGNIFIEVMTN